MEYNVEQYQDVDVWLVAEITESLPSKRPPVPPFFQTSFSARTCSSLTVLLTTIMMGV